MSNNVIEKFTSDFKFIARFFKEKRLGKNTLFEDDSVSIRHVGAVLDFFSVFTKDNRYREAYTKNIQDMKKKGDLIHMCYIAQSLVDKGISQGLSQGLSACVAALKMTGASFEKTFEIVTATETYANITQDEFMKYYNK